MIALKNIKYSWKEILEYIIFYIEDDKNLLNEIKEDLNG